MWAQLISTRLKAGKSEQDLAPLLEKLQATEQPGSGLVRSTAMIDQQDPSRMHLLVVFESEEAARARENDPRRSDGLAAVREMMMETFDGAPEFTNLVIVEEYTG